MYSNQKIGDVIDAYGVFTYKDPLIYLAIENINEWQHREAAIRMSPFIHSYISKLDEEILAEDPICDPDILSIDEIKKEWNEEHWNDLFIKIMDKARGHRYCVVQLYETPPYWRVFYERQIKKFIPDDKGNIVSCVVEWTIEIPKTDKQYINFKEEIKFHNPLLENNDGTGVLISFGQRDDTDGELLLGKNDLEQLWTLDVYIRYCLLDIAANSAKTSGFYHLVYGLDITPELKQLLLNALDLAGSMRGIGATRKILEEILPHYPMKPEFTVMALSEFIKAFAHAARLPLAYFRSEREQGGMFDVQSIDEVKINKKKRFLFKQFSSDFMLLIKKRWGRELKEIYPNIEEMENEKYKDEITVQIPNKSDEKSAGFNKEEQETDKEISKED